MCSFVASAADTAGLFGWQFGDRFLRKEICKVAEEIFVLGERSDDDEFISGIMVRPGMRVSSQKSRTTDA